jgi:hypothetical protein
MDHSLCQVNLECRWRLSSQVLVDEMGPQTVKGSISDVPEVLRDVTKKMAMGNFPRIAF